MDRDTDGQILVQEQGALLLIGIDRPEKRNGFTPKMLQELAAAYTHLEQNSHLWCGVLYAKGDHFTAGLDLEKIAPMRKEGKPLFPEDKVDPFNLREPRRTKPMVMAMKGIAFTLAVELMLAADIVIAADNCRFSQLEVKRGIMPSCGATFRFPERAGWGNAMRWLLTGDEFDAAEAFRLNLVQEVVPAGQEFDRAIEMAESIAAQAPLAVQAVLENARIAMQEDWSVAYGQITSTQTRLYNTDDAKEGVQSFIEKRPAKFTGK